MTPLELYLVQNMPMTYHATFTVVSTDKGAVIVGGIAVCDACDQVVATVDARDCDHRTLEALALRFNCEQPSIEELRDRIAAAVGKSHIGPKIAFA